MVYYIILLICDIHVYIMPRPSKYPRNLSCTTVLIRLPIFGWWLEDLGDGIDTLDYVYSCISFPVLYADNSLFKFEWHLNCMCTWILTWDSIETMAVWAQGCWPARVFHQWKACSNWRIWRPTGNHCFVPPQVREDCRKFDGTMFGNQTLEHNMNHAMLDWSRGMVGSFHWFPLG